MDLIKKLSPLEMFCFDVLGDFINPENIQVGQDRKGNWRVVVVRSWGLNKEFIWDEWKRQTAGTPWDGIPLYLPQ